MGDPYKPTESSMSLDELKSALPDYAGDLRANLALVVADSEVPRQRLWGTLLVCAIASRSPKVLRELEPEARANLSPEAYTAAKSAAAAMALNNVFFRTRHLLSDPAYAKLRAGLRMNIIGGVGVERTDYELWSLAVSAINGCGACLDSHERALRRLGVDHTTIQEAFKIAAVIQAVGTTLDAEAVIAG
jgi:alkyl hydroperoxide reductase subunit D